MELEVKFRTSAAGLKAALNSPRLASVLETKSQNDRTVYFDTRTFELQKHGSTLRVRKSGRTLPVQCYKSMSSSSLFERREFEVRLREMLPDIALFDSPVADELANMIGDHPLEPCFETVVHRRTRVLETGRSTVEVAFDNGVVNTSDQQVKLIELELELKTGTAEDLYALAEQLCSELPLSLDLSSKAAKGYALRQKRAFSPSKAASANLPRASSWDDVIAATLAETLRHFVANWAAFRTSDEPEALHQMRVALRRMRSAYSIFSREIRYPQFLELGEKARRIASGLGPARECDVFRINAEEGPLASYLRPAECAALLQHVEEQRRQQYSVARAMIEDPNTSIFVLQVQSMIARRSWSGASQQSQTTSHAPNRQKLAHAARSTGY